MSEAKVLVLDLETAPLTVYSWGLYDQNISLGQVKEDWFILSWAAKWLGKSKVFYMDNRDAKNIKDDKQLVAGLAALLNQADIVVTQNGDAFDFKKLNARAVINKLPPIKPYRSTDILKESRKVFKFTSHKLEYMTDKLNTKYKKLDHSKYPGFKLWSAILAGDKKAWVEMKKYNIHDVLSTEEAYLVMEGWLKTQNLAAYMDGTVMRCRCGSDKLERRGYAYTGTGKYQNYRCLTCGKWPRGTQNLLSPEKRKSLLREPR